MNAPSIGANLSDNSLKSFAASGIKFLLAMAFFSRLKSGIMSHVVISPDIFSIASRNGPNTVIESDIRDFLSSVRQRWV